MKKMLSLFAAMVMVMSLMVVPSFANSVVSKDCTQASNAADDVCVILKEMYGEDSGLMQYATGPKEGFTYSLTVTKATGEVVTIYVPQRPDVNDVTVKMGADGKLDVYGMGNGDANTWNQLFNKYKSVIVGISGVGAITFIALFIFQFMKLGASADNPQKRSAALSGCLWTGIAAAALGSVSIIAGFFYNAL